jgi:hypothetical protein
MATDLIAWLLVGGITLLGLLLLYVLEQLWSSSSEGRLEPDMRITVIGGGEEFLPVLDAAVAIGRKVAVVLTPVSSSVPWREIGPELLLKFAVSIARHPIPVRRLLHDDSTLLDGELLERATLINSACRIQGRLLVNLPPSKGSSDSAIASDDVINAFHATDLVVIGGDLGENVIPTLLLPEIARILRRSKRPRVLVHSNPEVAMLELESAGVGDIITHAIAPEQIDGPWRRVADVRNSGLVAQALLSIWLQSTKVHGLQRPLARAMHA